MILFLGARATARAGVAPSRQLSTINTPFRSLQTASSPTKVPTARVDECTSRGILALAAVRPWNVPIPTQAATFRSSSSIPDSHQFNDGKPTLEYAKRLPKTFASMPNHLILHLAEQGVPEACRECVVRDVMSVDDVEYDEAMKVFEKIAKTNREGMSKAAFPFQVGAAVSFGAGVLSFPLTFDVTSVKLIHDIYVTAELPGPEDMDTLLEVGSVSWAWMEPVMGQISFFLLCMQFARSQLKNLGIRPYYEYQENRRVRYLISKYPQYDPEFLALYSKSDRLWRPRALAA